MAHGALLPVQVSRMPVSPVDTAEEELLLSLSYLRHVIATHDAGEGYLPLFERLETELEQHRRRKAVLRRLREMR